jgi:hypothetical protein
MLHVKQTPGIFAGRLFINMGDYLNYNFLTGKRFNKGNCPFCHACAVMTDTGNCDELPVEF